MFNRKFLILCLSLLFIGYACDDDNFGVPVDNFDYAGQAIIDNDSLVDFLGKHYYNDAIDSVRPLVTGATALINDSRLITQDVTELDVDYKLYVFVKDEGSPNPVKGHPTVVDSILVKYKGQYFNSTTELIDFDERTIQPVWFTLHSVIRGWSLGFGYFKGGENITNNGPVTYMNGGKGVLFIPSGLAYSKFVTPGIPSSSSLLFYIELYDLAENTDYDGDSIPGMLEDLDGDGDPRNDNTDGDNSPNFLDPDDDNDGVLTKNEGGADGDPTNDFNDPNNPTLPDYLNPDIK